MTEVQRPGIVVVGASLAGLRGAEALRDRGYDGPLTLVGDEPHRPYDRPPLSSTSLRASFPQRRPRFRSSAVCAHGGGSASRRLP